MSPVTLLIQSKHGVRSRRKRDTGISRNAILSPSVFRGASFPLFIGDTSVSLFLPLSRRPSSCSSPPSFSLSASLPFPLSFYLCVRFREIKTSRQVSDAPNLSWQKYALSHAVGRGFQTLRRQRWTSLRASTDSAGLRGCASQDTSSNIPPKKTRARLLLDIYISRADRWL